MKRLTILLTVFLLGCSGIQIEHRDGRLPSIKIESGLKYCKWRPKLDWDLEVYLKCRKEISI